MSELRRRRHRGALKVGGHFREPGPHGDFETPRSWALDASVQVGEILQLCSCHSDFIFELYERAQKSEESRKERLWALGPDLLPGRVTRDGLPTSLGQSPSLWATAPREAVLGQKESLSVTYLTYRRSSNVGVTVRKNIFLWKICLRNS